MKFIANILGILSICIMASSTTIGTIVAYLIFRYFVDFVWWIDLPVAVLFFVIWHWGGYFLSLSLVFATNSICSVLARKTSQDAAQNNRNCIDVYEKK